MCGVTSMVRSSFVSKVFDINVNLVAQLIVEQVQCQKLVKRLVRHNSSNHLDFVKLRRAQEEN